MYYQLCLEWLQIKKMFLIRSDLVVCVQKCDVPFHRTDPSSADPRSPSSPLLSVWLVCFLSQSVRLCPSACLSARLQACLCVCMHFCPSHYSSLWQLSTTSASVSLGVVPGNVNKTNLLLCSCTTNRFPPARFLTVMLLNAFMKNAAWGNFLVYFEASFMKFYWVLSICHQILSCWSI